MNILTEWEDNSVSNGAIRRFEMVYPMKINLRDQDIHFRERLPDRYNEEDNIYQYFQNIGGDLMIYAMLGMIERRSRFLVVGKVPESNVWPVFACALDNISANGALIGLVTFFTDYAEKMIRRQKFCRGNFFATGSNYVEGRDKPVQQVIISEPYASENQFDGIYDRGNMMDAFCRVNVSYNLSGVYLDREKECFGEQGGYSARGFIKKAWGGIVNAILSKKVEKGSQFRIKSCGQTPFYCLLRYDGANVKTRTVFFTAISVSTNENDSAAAPIISRIDKGQNFVSSQEIENRRKEQIQQIDNDILSKNSNFERGENFKMSDTYKDDRYELKKVVETHMMKKIGNLISEAMKKVLLENVESEISIALQNAGAKVSEDEIIKYIIDYISDENNLNTDFGGDMASFSIDNDFDGIWVRCEGVVYYHKNVSKGDGYLVPDYNDLEIDDIKNSSLELYDDDLIGEWDITGVLNDSIMRKKQLAKNNMKITESKLKGLISKAIKESFNRPQPVGMVKNPIGYKCLRDDVYNAIMEYGFSAVYHEAKPSENASNCIAGPGIYFSLKEPDERMLSKYGRNVIKVKVLGEYPVYSGAIERLFVVPFNKISNIITVSANGQNMKNNIYGDKWTSSVSAPLNESELKNLISEAIVSVLSEEGIHIKDENKGKFNATKERTGKSTEELTHSKNPITKKRAIFAQNVKKWNKK